MEASDSADEVEKKLKLQLLAAESTGCVCCKGLEKSFLGWRPCEGQKELHKKRSETSRVGNQALLRREKTVLAATGDFLFRHYESSDRYVAQYRENHSTSCMERELNLMPVLGVDVPDPYLPKIATSRFVDRFVYFFHNMSLCQSTVFLIHDMSCYFVTAFFYHFQQMASI